MITSDNWKERGKFYTISNKQIFVIDEGEYAETIVILHGYPTSSYDYSRVLPELTKHFRVVIHDHLGFGFSDKVFDYYFTSVDQADYILEFCKQLGLKKYYFFRS